jgi:hypothetical protein
MGLDLRQHAAFSAPGFDGLVEPSRLLWDTSWKPSALRGNNQTIGWMEVEIDQNLARAGHSRHVSRRVLYRYVGMSTGSARNPDCDFFDLDQKASLVSISFRIGRCRTASVVQDAK